jgi:HK97 family phage prohead protease
MRLQGHAIKFYSIIEHDGNYISFCPGSFDRTLASKSTVRFLLDHDDTQCVATSDDFLTLYADRTALSFRLRFPSTTLGAKSANLVASKQYDAMSVGCTWKVNEVRTVDGISKNNHRRTLAGDFSSSCWSMQAGVRYLGEE